MKYRFIRSNELRYHKCKKEPALLVHFIMEYSLGFSLLSDGLMIGVLADLLKSLRDFKVRY